jgi:hypothetical protein
MTVALASGAAGRALRTDSRGGALRAHPLPGGERLALEQQLNSAWEGLLASGSAPCPVCGAGMRRDGRGGSCSTCGSLLA